jgi:hypothetical protein
MPLDELRLMPKGRVPLTIVQRYGAVPPEAAKVTE